MVSIETIISEYTKCTETELKEICPTLNYEGKEKGVYKFTTTNPKEFVTFMDNNWIIKKYVETNKGYYALYNYGIKITYIKCHKRWEFRKPGKLFAVVDTL